MTHRAPLVGCLRTDHRQSICQMCVSMSALVATQTPPPMATSNSPTLTVLR